MKSSRTVAAMFAIAFVIAIGAMVGQTANAAIVPTVGLGTAANFSVLAGTPNITNTGPTTIDRDVGIHPGSAVTGFPPGIVGGQIHAADSVALRQNRTWSRRTWMRPGDPSRRLKEPSTG